MHFKKFTEKYSQLINITIVIILCFIVAILSWQWQYREGRVGSNQKTEETIREIDVCKNIQNLHKKEKCYTAKAIETGEEKYCNKIAEAFGDKAFNSDCYDYIAIIKNEPELCQSSYCINDVFFQNTNLCKEISTNIVMANALFRRHFNYLPFLQIEGDLGEEIRRLEKEIKLKAECIKQIVIYKKDIEVAEKVRRFLSDDSQDDLAIQLGNPQLCSSGSHDCVAEIAIKSKNIEICKEAWDIVECNGKVIEQIPGEIGKVEEILLDDDIVKKYPSYAEWKIYRNFKYGFELKYPLKRYRESYHRMVPSFTSEPRIESIQCDYQTFLEECPSVMMDNYSKNKRITINNIPFCFRRYIDMAMSSRWTVYNYATVKDKECFVINFVISGENQQEQEKMIDQVLPTFRFLE